MEEGTLEIYDEYMRQMGLCQIFDWVKEHNPSGKLGYHNNDHLYHVGRLAGTLMEHSYSNVDEDMCRAIVAGMFHDINHSGGKITDFANVEHAEAMFLYFREQVIEGKIPMNNRMKALMFADLYPREEGNTIAAAIRATHWPWLPLRDMTYAQKCLRDADLLYSIDTDLDPVAIAKGLYEEVNAIRKEKLSQLTFLENQKKYLNTCPKMQTPAGEVLFEIGLNKRLLAIEAEISALDV